MPLVTLIIPVYNAARYLRRCLDSVLEQDFADMEVLVLNDGSRDRSLEICREYEKRDSRIRVVDKENTGVSDTRNRGMRLAEGKYLQFMDSDDWLTPDATNCRISIPWLCDLGGVTRGRIRGWRPDWRPGLGYYDTVHFAARITCPVQITAGLSDWTCPPSGVQVLYNQLKGRKELTFYQGLEHGAYFGYDQKKAARMVQKAPAALP